MELILKFILVGIFFMSCNPNISEDEFGKILNGKRLEIGIPILPEDWKIYDSNNKSIIWYNPDRKVKQNNNIPVHWSKTIKLDGSGQPLWESDQYYGSKDFVTIDGTFREKIYLIYYYQSSKQDSLWKCEIYNEHYENGKTVSLIQLDSILLTWNLNRYEVLN